MIAHQFDLTCNEIDGIPDSHFNSITPQVVNSAFTCELFLKALLEMNGHEKLRTHDLRELFDALPAKERHAIYSHYRDGFEKSMESPPPDRTLSYDAFLDDVAEVKDVFKDWRYGFEVPELSVRPWVLVTLRQSLSQHVQHRHALDD